MPCEYFLLIRRQRRPCLLAIDDGLSLAGQHAGRGCERKRFAVQFIRWNALSKYGKYVQNTDEDN